MSILEKLLLEGYTTTLYCKYDMVFIRADHPTRNILEAFGKTLTIATIVLYSRFMEWQRDEPLQNKQAAGELADAS